MTLCGWRGYKPSINQQTSPSFIQFDMNTLCSQRRSTLLQTWMGCRARLTLALCCPVSEQVDSGPHHPCHCHHNGHGRGSRWTGDDQGTVFLCPPSLGAFSLVCLLLEDSVELFTLCPWVSVCWLECTGLFANISISCALRKFFNTGKCRRLN